MTLAEMRAAAIDRALVGDDPAASLAVAGAADIAADGGGPDDPFAAAMLAVTATAADGSRTLDDRAWVPGSPAEPLTLVGAAAAVRVRGISVERAAMLAGCAPAAVEKAVEKRRRR